MLRTIAAGHVLLLNRSRPDSLRCAYLTWIGSGLDETVRGRTGDLYESKWVGGRSAHRYRSASGQWFEVSVMSQFKAIMPEPRYSDSANAHLERLMSQLARALHFSDERVELLESALRDIETILEQAREPRSSVREVQTPFIARGPATDDPIRYPEGGVALLARQDFDALTARERQIVQHLACGEANKVIARRLDLTEATVKVHLKTILRKLGLKNRTQVALCAIQQWSVRPAG
ncbi:MAG: response regulator transcription factor [Verrucomicrobiaceae bacterium]|nr:MAG: response regulator transcription factor [Verrucomicrobiaceae bacterium]